MKQYNLTKRFILFTKAYFKLLHHLPLPFDLEKLSTPTELLLGIDGVDAGVVVSILGPTDGGFDPVLEFRRETLFAALELALPCLFGELLVVVGIEDLGRVFEVPLHKSYQVYTAYTSSSPRM